MRFTEIVIFSAGEEAFGNDSGMPEKMRKVAFKSATFDRNSLLSEFF